MFRIPAIAIVLSLISTNAYACDNLFVDAAWPSDNVVSGDIVHPQTGNVLYKGAIEPEYVEIGYNAYYIKATTREGKEVHFSSPYVITTSREYPCYRDADGLMICNN